MNDKVAKYIQKQPPLQAEICRHLRQMILVNFPKIKETVMSEGLWYEGKFYIISFVDHVNLGVGINGLNTEELKQLAGKGKFMRHIKLFSPEDVNQEKLLPLMRLVYKKTKCTCQISWKD